MGAPSNSNTLTSGQSTLSGSSSAVIADNPNRIGLAIVNDDAAIKVYFSTTSAVSITNGHVVKPGTECVLYGYVGPVYMIAASGSPKVTFTEW